MIKTYKLTARMNNAHIVLEGKTGNKVIYDFADGNVVTNTPARIVLYSKYDQDLLESSEAFKEKIVVLEKVEMTEDELSNKSAKPEEKEGLVKEENIKTVTEAIAYVAEHFGEKAINAKHALGIAEENGVTFPNLKLGKK